MPPPYPLHGSGTLHFWNAFPNLYVLRAIQNRSYFLTVFRSHFGSIWGLTIRGLIALRTAPDQPTIWVDWVG